MSDFNDHPILIEFKNKYSLIGEKVTEEALFQYTRSSTILSLLKSNSIWGTSHKNLNDPTELSHGMSFFLERMEDFFKKISPNDFSQFIKFLEQEAYNPQFIKIFIASFTANKDLLSQWRGYGDYGLGLSIGFAPNDVILDEGRTSFWVKVVYDDAVKRKIVDDILQNLLNHTIPKFRASVLTNSVDKIIEAILLSLLQVSLVNAVRFKDKAWSEEEEWRLIQLNLSGAKRSNKQVHVRNRNHELIEYCNFNFKQSVGNAIKEVVIGPRCNMANQRSSLETVLAGNNIKITNSVIPWT